MAKKSKFDLSHERKLSFNMGKLIPIYIEDVLPGDKIRVNTECLLRMAPLLAPVMHRVNVFTHYWFVPYRLVWNEWQDFITGGKDGDLAPVFPYVVIPNPGDLSLTANGSLADYMGLPTTKDAQVVTNEYQISALPFRAYQMIYNEMYRDQNLSDPVPFSLGSGTVSNADRTAIMTIRNRAWEKDYFTSALPWAQRGGAAAAPVDYIPGSATVAKVPSSGALAPNQNTFTTDANATVSTVPQTSVRLETEANVDVQELRKAFRVQEWLEKNARGGARYIEVLLKHFGVLSSDARLQRPEYLGGSTNPIVISEVLSNFQFSGDPSGLPQGNMAGHGISAGSYHGFSRRFEEHGVILGIMSVLPRTCYQQGIHRMWERFDKFDFAWPTFASLGEQEVKSTEVYANYEAPQNTPATTFGYQERYADYKYGFNTVHGNFRDSLAYWHEGRIFASEPSLNENFVMSDPSTRIFAVEDPALHHLYAQVYNSVSAIRPLPFHGIPRT